MSVGARKAKPGEVTYALTLSETNGRTRVEFALGDLSIDLKHNSGTTRMPQVENWK
jgi:hypothetical protein